MLAAYENGKRNADTSTRSWWQIYAYRILQYKMRFHFIIERLTTANKFRYYFNLNCYHIWIEWILWLLCMCNGAYNLSACVFNAHRLPTNTDFPTIYSHSYDKLIERKKRHFYAMSKRICQDITPIVGMLFMYIGMLSERVVFYCKHCCWSEYAHVRPIHRHTI